MNFSRWTIWYRRWVSHPKTCWTTVLEAICFLTKMVSQQTTWKKQDWHLILGIPFMNSSISNTGCSCNSWRLSWNGTQEIDRLLNKPWDTLGSWRDCLKTSETWRGYSRMIDQRGQGGYLSISLRNLRRSQEVERKTIWLIANQSQNNQSRRADRRRYRWESNSHSDLTNWDENQTQFQSRSKWTWRLRWNWRPNSLRFTSR